MNVRELDMAFKKILIYLALSLLLLSSPLLLPTNYFIITELAACCIFVVLCLWFGIHNLVTILIPVVLLSVVIPTFILIFMDIPMSHSFSKSALNAFSNIPATDWLKLVIPTILSVSTYVISKRTYFAGDSKAP